MSRNFELMTQIEREAGATDKPKPGNGRSGCSYGCCQHSVRPDGQCRRRRDVAPHPAHISVGQRACATAGGFLRRGQQEWE